MTQAGSVLFARGVSKRFPGTLALDRVDFIAQKGHVSALVGENGAGKSTLMRILAGIEQPDSGVLEINGQPLHLASVRDAAARGIAMIHQELNLLPELSVTDNIFLGRELTRHGVVNRKAEERQARGLLERLNQPVDPRAFVGTLPTGQQQTVAIARALAQNACVLIMDEPTSALSAPEIELLFRVIRDLKAHGVAIIYVSHHLDEVLTIADSVTVLRDGRVVAETAAASISVNWIVEKMTGSALTAPAVTPQSAGTPLFTAQGISLAGELRGVSISASAGEIVGLYGLLGAGRTPLLETIAGLRTPTIGEMRLNGTRLNRLPVAERIAAGIALVPENRQRDALIPYLSVRENIMMASRSGWYVSPDVERQRAADIARDLRIRMGDLENPITSLSGGNQQKVVLARYLLTAPKLLLMDEPTCGVDISARCEIYEIIRRLAAKGMAVLFASSELEEVMALATRIVVMAAGRITAEFAAEETSEDALVAAATPLLAPIRGGRDAYR